MFISKKQAKESCVRAWELVVLFERSRLIDIQIDKARIQHTKSFSSHRGTG